MKRIKTLLHPIFFIFLLWFIFSSPYFLHGNVPFSSTYQTTFFPPWSAYPHDGMPVKNAAMPDVIGQIYPWRHLAIDIWKLGQIPLWNPYSFAGTPLLANNQSAVLSPFNIIFFALPFIDGWSLLVLLQPLLAGIFTYLYARKLGISRIGSVVSAESFMFCGFIVTWMDYTTLGYALLFLPLGLYAIESFFQSSRFRFLFLLSLVIPLSFFSGHFQISLYVIFALIAYSVTRAGQMHSWKKGAYILLYLFFGILLSLPQLLPSFEFYTQSLRSNLYQTIEVIPLSYLPTFLAPDFFGNPVTRNDWFGHYAEWNGYIGVFPLFLAFLGIKNWKKSVVRFFAVGSIIVLLLAFPSPLQEILVGSHFPVLATSALSRIIGIYSLFFALLAGFGWDHLILLISERKVKNLLVWFGFSIVCFIALWGIVFGKVFYPVDKIFIAKQNLLFPTLLFFSGIIVVGLSLFLPKKNKFIFLAIGMTFLIGFDMLRFATKWQPFDPKQFVFSNVPVTKEFNNLSGYNRAIGNYLAEVSNYYRLPGIEGYDALYPKRYGEFIASVSDGKLQESARSVVAFPKSGTYTPQAIDLLNVTYIVHKLSDDNAVWTFPYWTYPGGQFAQIYQDSAYRILQNTKAFPHAFLVGSYVVKSGDQNILHTLFNSTFNLRDKIVLEEDPHISLGDNAQSTSVITKYTPNDIVIKTNAKANAMLFLSDSFYPGWRATVDGKETNIYRADFAFRAIFVPQGKHTVEFYYLPDSFLFGVYGGAIGFFCLLVISLPFLRKYQKNK